MATIRMKYRDYKNHYNDCETVCDSYNKQDKTIEVVVPEGRMKNSGVRGKSFRYFHFDGVENGTGRKVYINIKATCVENAIKRLPYGCTWDIN